MGAPYVPSEFLTQDLDKDICKHLGIPPSEKVQKLWVEKTQAKIEAERLAHEWCEALDEHRRTMPMLERLVFAAYDRCPCGAGLAYDPAAPAEPGSPFRGIAGGAWDCSAILLGTAIPSGQPGSVKHTDRLPFAFWNVKSEGQPSAGGATTRPK